MIIQCEQCNTKFRLDDAKIKGRGVKVRCSKCKHVFLVQKEERPGTTFGDLLGQYGESGGAAFGVGAGSELAGSSANLADEPVVSAPSVGPVVAETSEAKEGASIAASLHATSSGTEPASPDNPDAETGRFDSDGLTDEYGPEPGSSSIPDEPAGFDLDYDFTEADQSQQLGTTSSGGTSAEIATRIDASFDTTPQPDAAPDSTTAEDFSIDFGELTLPEESVGDRAPLADGKASARDEFNLDFDDVFGEAPALQASASSTPAAPADDEAFSPASSLSGEKNDDDLGGLDFGDLDLGELSSPNTRDATTDHEVFPKAASSTPAQSAPPAPTSPGLAEDSAEELPPLTISSRRKGASFFPAAITITAIIIVVILAGVGFFVVSGPEAMKKMGLGFLVTLTGGAQEEGKISLGKISAEFVTNNEAGELFVIRGETINNYSKPRASIQVKATLLGANGQSILNKQAYCGNNLTKEQLTMLSLNKLEEVMNNQFGDSLSNLGVQPGKSIPFVVVFASVPKEAVDFSVSVAGSTVAAK